MATVLTYSREDQKRRRQRARITQQEIASKLAISDAAVSKYELGGGLPFGLTDEDYERALAAVLIEKGSSK